ncbi:MAG: peptidase M23 [Alphaproteobacteria bacterium]|nr:peptidase M23 [Alphaproteobacteria bacterium]
MLLAIAAAAIALPVVAFTIGSLVGSNNKVQVTTPASTSTSPAISAVAPKPGFPKLRVHKVKIENGDSLIDVLIRAGAERADAHSAVQSLKGVYDPRRDLRIGDELRITLSPVNITTTINDSEAIDYQLKAVYLPVTYDHEVEVARTPEDSFIAQEIEIPLTTELIRVKGSIDSSLFVNGRDAGIPISVLVDLIRIYSFDVDFQRDIWNGDAFDIMFERQRDESDVIVNNGEIHYATLTLRGTRLPLYKFETSKGTIDYFNEKGESVRKALMKTPLDGARLSSRFGNRKHPILGYTRLHAGVDFAAPTGTPIYAAGDGTVEIAKTNGGYGKYIRIRHNGTYSTAYAHLNGYARGIRRGKRVRQGQVIGYVGSTGRSTGPHLHYEIHRDGRPINPLGLKLPSGEKLVGERLEKFQELRAEVNSKLESLALPAVTAENDKLLSD